jgi:tRNA A37 N6-isopentenylltransferase MiaA
MELVPIDFKEACEFVRRHHRHHKPPVGHKYSIACYDGEKIVGVAIVGRPVARMLDNGLTLEVVRLCSDGTKNVCSMLYSSAWRAARAIGYKKLITYVLKSEGGHSLKASGWKLIGEAGGGKWSRKNRPRLDEHPTEVKLKFEIE